MQSECNGAQRLVWLQGWPDDDDDDDDAVICTCSALLSKGGGATSVRRQLGHQPSSFHALQAAAGKRPLAQLCHCADIGWGVVPGKLARGRNALLWLQVQCMLLQARAVLCSNLVTHPAAIHLPPKAHLSLAPQVKRKLLRPCISLTKAVRSEEQCNPEVTVDVDTLTFDRQALLDS